MINLCMYFVIIITIIDAECSIMEVLVVHSREHLNLTNSKGQTPLYLAASQGHTQVCSLLAAQVGPSLLVIIYSNDKDTDCSHNPIYCTFQASVNINIQLHESKITPLHMAINKSHWSVVECLVGWGALLNVLNVVNCDGNTPLHVLITLRSVKDPGSPQIKQVN